MSTKDYSAKLLEMEGVRIENLEESEKEIVLQISLERRTQICRCCGTETERVHDYRIRQVRDLELRGKPLRLLYRRRRYVCPVCGKRFAEQNTFVGRYMRFTHRTGEKIMTLLRRRSSMKDAAKDAGVSISGVQRVLKIAPVSKPSRLPEAVSFDEFKGNAGGERFQCIVTDPLNRRVFDILPSQTVETIQDSTVAALLFRLGWFEVDDILHNTLGTYLDICLYRWMVNRAPLPARLEGHIAVVIR